jgi:diaminopimelate epimerase
MRFHKYHALGNDYLVLDPAAWPGGRPPPPERVRAICDRHRGAGSDGILWGPTDDAGEGFGLRIFNPDGSEAEKSGNGLRIFARYLFDQRRVGGDPFVIRTAGGPVRATVRSGGREVEVGMGRVSFRSGDIPVAGPDREVLRETLEVGGESLEFSAAGIGNPHCVVRRDTISPELARRLGPLLETHPLFPRRTNVQFLRILDRANLALEIWERGAGYTLASGSSSCAAAAVAHRLGWVDDRVTVHLAGGTLALALAPDFSVTMTGPVVRVATGTLDPEFLGGAA